MERSSVQFLPSSLVSLAQGCCVLATGDVLGLAPAHDGFFATDARAAFDEAEPMVVRVKCGRSDEAWRLGHVDVCTNLHVQRPEKKVKVSKKN